MSRCTFQLFLITLFVCVLAQPTMAQSCPDLRNRIELAQQWIVNAQLDDGLFTYEYNIATDEFSESNNIVRQVGTFWALVESLRYFQGKATVKAVNNFREKISSLVVHSKAGDKDIAYIEFNDYGKINTSALYILSLLSLKEQGFELTNQEKKDIPLFIEGMREMSDNKGGFWYIYYMPEEYNFISTYGSGEAIYAMARYYDLSNDVDGLEWTYNEFVKYYDRYLKEEDDFQATEARAFFSWAIYGLAIINKKFPIKYESSVKPLLTLGFDKRESNELCKDRGCLLAPNLGDAPFMEGIVQAYKMALIYEKDEKEIAKIKEFLDLALNDFIDLQVTDMEKFKKDFDFKGDEKRVFGSFCRDEKCETMRNDLTQHALSAVMYYHEQFCPPAEETN